MHPFHLIFAFLLASTHYFFYDDNDTLPIVYHLFTRLNPTVYQELRLNDLSALLSSNYNPDLPTKFYVPGWNNNGSFGYSTRDEYLKRDNINYIVIYWQDIQEGDGNGIFVVRTTKTAALHAAVFIDFLVENGTPISAFHLIGHGVGTHLAGGAGTSVSYGIIPRITGLDPGDGPFDLNDTSTRLDSTDAEFVDIIHTNGGEFLNGDVAFDKAVGHVDFYVNGGHKQPDLTCCSHCRATDYFAESINTPVGFVSLRCDSYKEFQNGSCGGNEKQLMGDTVSLAARGTFYVDTNSQAPWAIGDVN